MNPVFKALAWQSIKKNLKYLIVVSLLLTISCIMFISLVIPIFSMGQKLVQINKSQNVEDVNLVATNKLTSQQLHKIEAKYKLKIEENNAKVFLLDNKNLKSYLTINQNVNLTVLDQKQKLVNLNVPSNKYALVISEQNSQINKLYTQNKLKDNELAFDQSSFQQRRYDLKQHINISGIKYNVVPATFVNNIYPAGDLLLPNTKALTFASLNKNSYQKLVSKYTQTSYHGKFINNLDFKQRNQIYQKLVKSDILGTTKIYKIQDKTLNPSISVPNDKIIGSQMSTFVMVIFITTLSIVIVISLINKLLTKDIETIGVLKSLGYENNQIANIYLLFPLTCFVIAALISLLVGPYIGSQTLNLYYLFFSIPKISGVENTLFNVSYLIIILITLVVATRFKILRFLTRKTLDILNNVNQKDNNIKKIVKMKNKGSFIKQIQYLNFMFNKSIFVYFIYAMLLASSLFYLSLSILNVYDQFTSNDNIYKPQTQQFFKQKQEEKNLAGEFNIKSLLLTKVKNEELASSNLVNVYGLNARKPNIKLQNLNSNTTKVKNNTDFVISNKLATFFNLKKGDKITLSDMNSQKEFTFKISDILVFKDELSAYINNNKFNQLFNNNIKQVMGRFTNDKYSSNQVEKVQTSVLTKLSNDFISLQIINLASILGFAILIAGAIIWILTKNLILKNKEIIEVMLLLGFSTKEIRKIVLTPFNIWVVIIGIVTYPLIIFGLNFLFASNAQTFNMIIQLQFNFVHWIIGYILYLTTYFIFINLSARILNKSDISKINKNEE